MKALYAVLLALVLGVGCGKDTGTGTSLPPEPSKATPKKLIDDPIVEAAIRKSLKKPEGELTKVDLEKVTSLNLSENRLTELPKGLEKLTQLKKLNLLLNNNLTMAQIDELYEALKIEEILHNAEN